MLPTVIAGALYRSANLYHPRRRAILHIKSLKENEEAAERFRRKTSLLWLWFFEDEVTAGVNAVCFRVGTWNIHAICTCGKYYLLNTACVVKPIRVQKDFTTTISCHESFDYLLQKIQWISPCIFSETWPYITSFSNFHNQPTTLLSSILGA